MSHRFIARLAFAPLVACVRQVVGQMIIAAVPLGQDVVDEAHQEFGQRLRIGHKLDPAQIHNQLYYGEVAFSSHGWSVRQ